ncbi:probable aspartyl protease At4g16563 [Punica granatum]|uniref:Uncharacterized protein n=2 Tax=Punica granatum TaxID=22663 RepID=A0A2I0I751_PUNGR|nr:probable aspartyl protease At4g16563 [Punica granatum]PKI39808.1 hypothetical protein CRG98_039853 [Punica granatum]
MASSMLLVILIFACFSASCAEVLFLPLKHSLAGARFNRTPHHLLKSTAAHSAARFHRHHQHRHLSSSTAQQQVSLPLLPGSDYTLSLTVASRPPQSVSLYMDTGSDLVWFPCSPFTCILCDGKPKPKPATLNFSSSTASTVSCQSASCSAAHSSTLLPSSDLCAIARCPLDSIETSDCDSYPCPPFYYAYGDGSFTARLHRHTVSIPMSSPPLVLPNFTFGCAHSALGEPVGVAGFGRGVLSLPAQLLKLSPQLGNQFSYCLVSHSFDANQVNQPSLLILGRSKSKQKSSGSGSRGGIKFVFTPMLDNPRHPYFYSVGLMGVSVGKKNIPAPIFLTEIDGKGNGGMVVDSGTTFTMLPATLYNAVVAELDYQLGRVRKRAKEIEAQTGLSPCYYIDDKAAKSDVPNLSLHFAGDGKSSSMVLLPRANYFYEFVDGSSGPRKGRTVGCLMIINGGDEADLAGGPGAILGNYQQQGFEVVYDLEKKRVGFARQHCSSLWDNLKQR